MTASAEFLAAAAQPNVQDFVLVRMSLDSGPLCMTSCGYDVDWLGETYRSLAGIATMEPIRESGQEATGIAFTMPAVNDSAVAAILNEPLQGRKVEVMLAIVSDGRLLVHPNAWVGFLDVPSLELGARNIARVTAEHAMVRWQVPAGKLFSDEDQQADHPGDRFFEYAAELADKVIHWPRKEFFQR